MSEEPKAIKSILKDLGASDQNIVIEAIQKNRKEGNAKTFNALLKTLKNTDEPNVEAEIIQFLFDLKDEDSIPILIDAIQDREMHYYQSFLVATFWQSAINGSDYLEVFVKAAIEGEYMTTLEALTVVENFDDSFSQSELIEQEAELIQAAENESNESKKVLLVSMADVVRNLPIVGE